MTIPRAHKGGVRDKTMERSGVTKVFRGTPHEEVALGRQESLAAFRTADPEVKLVHHRKAEKHFENEIDARRAVTGAEPTGTHAPPYKGAIADRDYHSEKVAALVPIVQALRDERHNQKLELDAAREHLIGLKTKPTKAFKVSVRGMTLEQVQAKLKDFK